MKYLVMECRPAYAVVLGDDGAFRKVANLRYAVGQTVTDVIPLNLPEVTLPQKTKPGRWISAVSALAACLVLVLSMFLTGQMPYASVYLTINPEVRIDVSRSDVVVAVAGMNADGAELLEGYDHRKKELDTVMDELVDRAIDMGYLHEGGRITLSLDGDKEWIVSHETHLDQHLNDHLTDKLTVTIDIEQGQPSKPTQPAQTIVIPIEPSYDDSDYGETTTPTNPPVKVPDPINDSTLYVNYPINTPASGEVMKKRPLYHNLMKRSEYYAKYHEYFDFFIESYFESGYFETFVEDTADMISSYVEKDPTAFCSFEDWQLGVDTIKNFCLLRSESVRGQLDGTIPSTIAAQERDKSSFVDASDIWLPDMGEIADLKDGYH